MSHLRETRRGHLRSINRAVKDVAFIQTDDYEADRSMEGWHLEVDEDGRGWNAEIMIAEEDKSSFRLVFSKPDRSGIHHYWKRIVSTSNGFLQFHPDNEDLFICLECMEDGKWVPSPGGQGFSDFALINDGNGASMSWRTKNGRPVALLNFYAT